MISKFNKFLMPVFLILVVVFFALYLRDIDYSVFKELRINWVLLLIATIISLGFRYWGVFIWRFILKDLGANNLPRFSLLTHVYAKAWMGRYIPGTVTWIASKIYLANKLGISKSRLAVSSLLEGGMQIVASMAVALLILGIDPRLDVISPQIKLVMILIAVCALVVLYPPIFNTLLRKAYSIIRRRRAYDELRTNGKATIRSFILYALGAILVGSSYYFLTASLYEGTDGSMYWYIVGAFTLAGALGMATPFVPSGLGVRDGAQLVLLSLIMPKEIALAITVFSRLWSALVDVLFYVFAELVHRLHKK